MLLGERSEIEVDGRHIYTPRLLSHRATRAVNPNPKTIEQGDIVFTEYVQNNVWGSSVVNSLEEAEPPDLIKLKG